MIHTFLFPMTPNYVSKAQMHSLLTISSQNLAEHTTCDIEEVVKKLSEITLFSMTIISSFYNFCHENMTT